MIMSRRNKDIATVACVGAAVIVAGAHKHILKALGFKKHHHHKHHDKNETTSTTSTTATASADQPVARETPSDVLTVDENVLTLIRDGKIDMEKVASLNGKIRFDYDTLMPKIMCGVLDPSLFENENFKLFAQAVGFIPPAVQTATSTEDVVNQQNAQVQQPQQTTPAIDPNQAMAAGMNITAQPASGQQAEPPVNVVYQNYNAAAQQNAQPQAQQAIQAPQQ